MQRIIENILYISVEFIVFFNLVWKGPHCLENNKDVFVFVQMFLYIVYFYEMLLNLSKNKSTVSYKSEVQNENKLRKQVQIKVRKLTN